ncbi:MAG: hypothetical protein RJA19_1655, partial [Bacteroidota bacterium]
PNREVKPTSADGTAIAGEYVDATLKGPLGDPFLLPKTVQWERAGRAEIG